MRVRRVILKDVNNFQDFDHSFEDEWTGQVPQSLLLMGPNGSGKTTLLEAITQTWSVLPKLIDPRWSGLEDLSQFDSYDWELAERRDPFDLAPSLLSRTSLVAVELVGIEAQSLWIAYASSEEHLGEAPFIREENAHRVGVVRIAKHRTYRWFYVPPGKNRPQPGSADETGWASRWQRRLSASLFGKDHKLPNMLYLPSESRVLQTIADPFTPQPEPEEYQWLAVYAPTERRKGSIQNYLYHLKVVDEERFDRIADQVNRFLADKRLVGFDRRTGELMVETEGNGRHPIHLLSGGEKQVLLMIAWITRWLRPGGVVLIDEPDLHLHVSLTNALVDHLHRMVAEQDGQLIIASHAPELWDRFTESQKVKLGELTEAGA